jgi:hypothetical protein
MQDYFRSAWRENNGWWLLTSAALIGSLLCLLWFFQLLPEVWIASPNNQPILSQTIQSQNSILVAQVNATENAMGKKGFIFLYRPEGFPNDLPAYQQGFELDESGMVTLLMVLPSGTYKTVAFLDLNDNGQLDFDGDQPLEPIRFPASKSLGDQDELDSPLEITLAPRDPVFCLFEFDEI